MALKETQEFIELIDVLGNEILEAKADGKLDWRDAPRIVPIAVALRTAVKGADQILGEVSEIADNPAMTNLLLQQLLAACVKLGKAVIR